MKKTIKRRTAHILLSAASAIILTVLSLLSVSISDKSNVTDVMADAKEFTYFVPKYTFISNHRPGKYTVSALSDTPNEYELPILMYHHIDNTEKGSMIVSEKRFEEQLDALKNAGYTTISIKQAENFVLYGAPLPEKPIIITFDDGYLSNYEKAFPILKEKNMKASIFIIGWAVGKDEYKNTGRTMFPHFDYSHAREMSASGIIEIQSHTYDMHQFADYEANTPRQSVTPFENESSTSFIKAIQDDYNTFSNIYRKELGTEIKYLSYPHGKYTKDGDDALSELGITVTMTSDYNGKNIIRKGFPRTLRTMYRFAVTEELSGNMLVKIIEFMYK